MVHPRSTPRPTKRRKTILIVIALLIATPLFLVGYNYIDMRINKPLGNGSDFLFIKQEITTPPAVPTETFYYATDVPPEEFASKFEGWKIKGTDGSLISIVRGSNWANIHYSTPDDYNNGHGYGNLSVSDFKNKKYIIQIHGVSMYYLNPSNIHWSMKDQIQQDIQRNYIR